jgi:hypothetical protein
MYQYLLLVPRACFRGSVPLRWRDGNMTAAKLVFVFDATLL